MPTNMTKTFIETYKLELTKALIERPYDYNWTMDEFDLVFERMEKAILAGTFNKDSTAIKRTCKKLGIKHTYKAIREYLAGEEK